MVPGGLDWQLCWHGVCPLTARTQQSLRLHLVQFGLPALSNLQGVSLCLSFRNAICTSFPCLQPWLSSSEDEPGNSPRVPMGQGGVLTCCTKPLIILWNVCKDGVRPQGPYPVTPVLGLHPVTEPACFSDTRTQLALCYNQCFHSFPKQTC